jgi:CBS domain-containing protein
MLQFPFVTKYMATQLITFKPDTFIWEAIDVIIKKKISGAPVLNEAGELVGMLSEFDCLRILVDGAYNDEPQQMLRVADFMSGAVTTIRSNQNVFDAANIFLQSGLKRLPVIENGKVVGQISRVDVLRAIQEIKPPARHIPDTWKGREPTMADHKKTRHTENT